MSIQRHIGRRPSAPTGVVAIAWVMALSACAFANSPAIDNFAPYVEEFKLWYLYGEPGAQDTAFVYHAKWEAQPDGTNTLAILHEEAAPDAELSFYIKFNEPVTGPQTPYKVMFNHAGELAAYPAGNIDVPAGEYSAEFFGRVAEAPDAPSPKMAPFGKYEVVILAQDTAGNYLDITPESPARRTSTGDWSDPNYAPATDNPDTNHYFNVAPALWVVEGHWNRTYDLVGYRRTAGLDEVVRTSLPFDIDLLPGARPPGSSPHPVGVLGRVHGPHTPGAWSEYSSKARVGADLRESEDRAPGVSLRSHITPRAYVASDPTDGSCWVYGNVGGSPVIKRVSPSGQLQPAPSLAVCEGLPVWIGVHHGSRTVLAIGETHNAGVYLVKYTPSSGSGWEVHTRTLAEAEIATFYSASIDQSAGLLWAGYSAHGDSPRYTLSAIDIGTLEITEVVVGDYYNYALASVAANPMDNTVWAASLRSVGDEGCEYFVARFDQAGTQLQDHVITSITPYAGAGGMGVCSFPSDSACMSANCLSWGVYTPDPKPWGHYCPAPVDRLARVGTGGSCDVEDISIPGIGIWGDQAEEYIDNCHFSACRIENGIYWVRHHMPEDGLDPDNCYKQTGISTYWADVYLISSDGAGGYVRQPMTSVAFPGFVLDPENEHLWAERLSVYGMSCISACAGAKWVQPEGQPAARLALGALPVGTAAESGTLSRLTYRLGGVYPNPCEGCPGLIIEYSLGGPAAPRFELFNLAGQRVGMIGPGAQQPGEHRLDWSPLEFSGKRVPPATYILQMRTEEFVARTPVLVIK